MALPRIRTERQRTWLTLVITAVLVAGVGLASLGPSATAIRELVGLGGASGGDGNGHDFAFIRTRHGHPVGFDPCRPIHYQVNPDQGPPDATDEVGSAVQTVAQATGLTFVDDGTTSDDDFFDRRSTFTGSPEPVLIGWSTSDRVGELEGDVAGVTSSDYDTRSGYYDTGRVVLDADAFDRLQGEPGGAYEERAILLHELGHLVGLAHVDDPRELMYPTVGTRSAYGAGDLAGLAEIGAIGC